MEHLLDRQSKQVMYMYQPQKLAPYKLAPCKPVWFLDGAEITNINKVNLIVK